MFRTARASKRAPVSWYLLNKKLLHTKYSNTNLIYFVSFVVELFSWNVIVKQFTNLL
jgi:hypothetical protein